MNTIELLDNVAKLRPATGKKAIIEVLVDDFKTPKDDAERRPMFATSPLAGSIFLYRSKLPLAMGRVLEIVTQDGEETMSTLFEDTNHPFLQSPGEMIKAREALVRLFAKITGTEPGYAMLMDETRKRGVRLQEMATMQICDLILERFKQKGIGV